MRRQRSATKWYARWFALIVALALSISACEEQQAKIDTGPQVRLKVGDETFTEPVYSYCWPQTDENVACDVDLAARAQPARLVPVAPGAPVSFDIDAADQDPQAITVTLLDGPGGQTTLAATGANAGFTSPTEPGQYRVQVDVQYADVNGSEAYVSYVFGFDVQAAAIAAAPSGTPTEAATEAVTEEPTVEPTSTPTEVPSETPTVEPTTEPTATPTTEPTVEPTTAPTDTPVSVPSPTAAPTLTPRVAAAASTKTAEAEPTEAEESIEAATEEPTEEAGREPTEAAAEEQTEEPTEEPTETPPAVALATEAATEAAEEATDVMEPTRAVETESPETEEPTAEPTQAATEEATEEATSEPTEEPLASSTPEGSLGSVSLLGNVRVVQDRATVPLTNAEVTLTYRSNDDPSRNRSAQTTTDETGRFAFEPTELYEADSIGLTISAPGYATQEIELSGADAYSLPVLNLILLPLAAPTAAPTASPTATPAPVEPTPTPSPEAPPTAYPSGAPLLNLAYAGRTYEPLGYQMCEPDSAGALTSCVQQPTGTAPRRRLSLMRGAAAQLLIAGERPSNIHIEYLTDNGVKTGQPEDRPGDNTILLAVLPEPGNYILAVRVTWEARQVTYYFRVAVTG